MFSTVNNYINLFSWMYVCKGALTTVNNSVLTGRGTYLRSVSMTSWPPAPRATASCSAVFPPLDNTCNQWSVLTRI